MNRSKFDENGVRTHTYNGNPVGPGVWCGTANAYNNHMCRCEACTAAWRETHRRYMNADPERLARHAAREAARRARARADSPSSPNPTA